MESDERPPDTTSAYDSPPKANWTSLVHFTTRKHAVPLAVALFFSVGAGVMVPMLAVLLGRIFNAFSSFGEGSLTAEQLIHSISVQCLYLLGLGMIIWLLQMGYFTFWISFGELQAKNARDETFKELLKKDLVWFEMKQDGVTALLPRLQTQIRDLQLATSQPLGCVIQRLITFVTAMALALYTSWKLTLVSLASIPICIIIIAFISKKVNPSIQAHEAELSSASKLAGNAFSSIDAVKYFNGQNFEVRQYSTAILSAARWYTTEAFAEALQVGCIRLMIFGMYVQGFWYGSYLVGSGILVPGDVLTAFWACLQATHAIEDILPHIIVLEKGRAAAAALKQIMNTTTRDSMTDDTSQTISPEFCEGDIRFENVTFSYPARPDCHVLKEASFFFPAGDMTFVVGRSGSGKSTVANLLMRFYAPTSGNICIDGTPIEKLNIDWIRNNVTLIQQQSFLFNETIFKNIAFGSRDYQSVTEDQILASLHVAYLDETIQYLADGLNTVVGVGGSAFSGGQRQRVAIARARLRDTPILILDESTSALDFTSRSAVIDAIRIWRKDKTTIMITHDMSQINDQDFVYVLQHGEVVRKGYKQALDEGTEDGVKPTLPATLDGETSQPTRAIGRSNRSSLQPAYFAGEPATSRKSNSEEPPKEPKFSFNQERNLIFEAFSMSPMSPSSQSTAAQQPISRPEILRPLTPRLNGHPDQPGQVISSSGAFELAELNQQLELNNHSDIAPSPTHSPSSSIDNVLSTDKLPHKPMRGKGNRENKSHLSMRQILFTVFPSLTLRSRILLLCGYIAALVHAAVTPVFAILFAQLLGSFYLSGDRSRMALQSSLAIVVVAVANGVASFFMDFLLECSGEAWVNCLRAEAMTRILSQPKGWFEKEENRGSTLTMCLDRNAEEMRNLVGRFSGFVFVAAVIMIMAVIWGVVVCWKLTLVGLASAPVVYSITRGFEAISGKWESRCNDAGEAVGDIFSETFLDIKTVRSLTLESYFHKKLDGVNTKTLQLGLKRACYSGFFFGLSNSSIIFVYTLVFYYGAVLASSLAYSTKDIIAVFSMLLFSLSNVNAALGFVPQISSSRDTATRVLRLATLPKSDSHEDKGNQRIPHPFPIKFTNVNFTYPSRPKKPVLQNLTLTIPANTCTAIVGPSGSGKSTIAALLTTLYTPTSTSPNSTTSTITLAGTDILKIHTPTLRTLISIVPQQPTLFPASIRANIAYGLPPSSPLNTTQNIHSAARAAGIDDFITSLPDGYNTLIGDGGLCISGGQAQRLIIARALVRKPRVLVLDEATANLDGFSIQQIRETVRKVMAARDGVGAAVVIITHAVEMMEIADRVVVVDGGRVVEEGEYRELMGRVGGELRRLMTMEDDGR
ncbi:hypothetical protein FQN52_000826 [Onygenales sp. PD_12]|nr:hypothetical protein FQN52_000826 [Onygenales sp. PD_12]